MSEHGASVLSERLFDQAVATMEAASVWLGRRLGWYASLHEDGPATARELAERTRSQPRYAREWLEQQAVAGIVIRGEGERYELPAGHAEALLDRDSQAWTEPLIRQIVSAVLQLPALADAYRTGQGVPWHAYGAEMSEAQGDLNRPMLLHALARDWVPQIPDLHERLVEGARVADVGCGQGWSGIGLATAYPEIEVDGFDLDPVALEAARENAAEAGVAERVRFHHADAAADLAGGPYDVLMLIECLHDMPRPVEVLSAMRRVAKPGAVTLVVDEAADPVLTAPGDEVQRLLYGFSLLVCLPDSLSHPHSAGVGTVMRPDTLASFASSAGYAGVESLDVTDTGFWRIYRLVA
ncbi:class I SAM-dependent methyltransferase [Actinomadura chokoriensis]|uniref:Class I SAM-dependent methyltransferase n=1 Tax=Actinomadura chokoriensis TaxID=454156 RepID=A0ABV4QYN9_9ACTN